MSISNIEYYRKRIEEESRRAASETDISVRHVHQSLVKMYRIKLQAEEVRAQPSGSGAQHTRVGLEQACEDSCQATTIRVPAT
ncbi:hypothetical protein [Novosphingobium sp. Gsoil 351]|uniref:hypothetical protein n=1 Tax=Novosphingobium sp. Gsoil 351 TaxID=2675225 RepID=UPI0012B466BB|nr:hypothetical protein [Novosphingobium sp. Gsoil 351]QGN55772.1 hypothetical protein GKE62_15665 [Novosphingobium sp. Gsoil 351]